MRHTRSLLALLTAVMLLTGCGAQSAPVARSTVTVTSPVTQPTATPIPASTRPASQEVQIGPGVTVKFDEPPAPGAVLNVQTLNAPTLADKTAALATPIKLSLTGSAMTGATLEFPIPAGVAPDPSVIHMRTFDEQTRQWMEVPSTVDPIRRVITVHTTHFSWWNPTTWDWASIGAATSQAVGQIVGKRAGRAECDPKRPAPSWVRSIVGVSNEDAIAVRACAQSEGDILDVQLVNNRPYGLVLKLSGKIKWTWHDPGSSGMDIALNKAMDAIVGKDGLYLPPRGKASLGIYAPDPNATLQFRITPTKASLLVDLLKIGLDVAEIPGASLATALIANCGLYALQTETPTSWDSGESIRGQLVGLADCAESAFKSLLSKGALDKHKVDELSATLKFLKNAQTVGWILRAYDVEWKMLDLWIDSKLAPGLASVGHGFIVYAGGVPATTTRPAPTTAPPTTMSSRTSVPSTIPTTAPIRTTAAPASRPVTVFANYGTVTTPGRPMCLGNPARPESMPGGTVSQTFTVPAGVAGLDSAVVQIDPNSSATATMTLAVNGATTRTISATPAGDTRFNWTTLAVRPGDQITMSLSFRSTYGKIITVYTVGAPGGRVWATNTCSDGAPSFSSTATGLRAEFYGHT